MLMLKTLSLRLSKHAKLLVFYNIIVFKVSSANLNSVVQLTVVDLLHDNRT